MVWISPPSQQANILAVLLTSKTGTDIEELQTKITNVEHRIAQLVQTPALDTTPELQEELKALKQKHKEYAKQRKQLLKEAQCTMYHPAEIGFPELGMRFAGGL